MDVLILTNNPLVRERIPDARLVDGSALDVLTAARDLIHRGRRLLTHPMSGSIPPDRMPYRSLLLTTDDGPPDPDSLALIETAVLAAARALSPKKLPAARLRDFQLIDADLLNYGRGTPD